MAVYPADVMLAAARLTGYPVVEVAGWRQRGHGGFRAVEGACLHHTADGPNGNYPSLGVVTNGRAGLAGPLANFGLGRDGTIYLIAAGVGWHAGASTWAGFVDLNDEFLGWEAESVGTRDDWTPAQRDCYPRGVAACLHYLRRGSDRACGHKECALPKGRKIDPAYWDLGALRAQVGWMLADPLNRIPRTGTSQGDDDLDARQNELLTRVHQQLTGSPEPNQYPGWPAFQGGTNETLTIVDYVRRNNQQVTQLTGQVNALAAEVAKLKTGGVDPATVAAAVAAELVRRLQA